MKGLGLREVDVFVRKGDRVAVRQHLSLQISGMRYPHYWYFWLLFEQYCKTLRYSAPIRSFRVLLLFPSDTILGRLVHTFSSTTDVLKSNYHYINSFMTGGPCHKETSPLICWARMPKLQIIFIEITLWHACSRNQRAGFYMTRTSVMKELTQMIRRYKEFPRTFRWHSSQLWKNNGRLALQDL